MHEVRAKGILSAQNGMNIYRGCVDMPHYRYVVRNENI